MHVFFVDMEVQVWLHLWLNIILKHSWHTFPCHPPPHPPYPGPPWSTLTPLILEKFKEDAERKAWGAGVSEVTVRSHSWFRPCTWPISSWASVAPGTSSKPDSPGTSQGNPHLSASSRNTQVSGSAPAPDLLGMREKNTKNK